MGLERGRIARQFIDSNILQIKKMLMHSVYWENVMRKGEGRGGWFSVNFLKKVTLNAAMIG